MRGHEMDCIGPPKAWTTCMSTLASTITRRYQAATLAPLSDAVYCRFHNPGIGTQVRIQVIPDYWQRLNGWNRPGADWMVMRNAQILLYLSSSL